MLHTKAIRKELILEELLTLGNQGYRLSILDFSENSSLLTNRLVYIKSQLFKRGYDLIVHKGDSIN